jgi:hypothetical protein
MKIRTKAAAPIVAAVGRRADRAIGVMTRKKKNPGCYQRVRNYQSTVFAGSHKGRGCGKPMPVPGTSYSHIIARKHGIGRADPFPLRAAFGKAFC